jgi:hypothetical protein
MTVQAVFSADDPDLPAQSLTFSLETGAPAGASINPVSGLFTWTPTLEHSDMNGEIRVRVTDSGVPPLIDVISLGVVVQALRVEFQDSNQAGGTNVIAVSTIHHRTIPGRQYRLQYKERLESPTWIDVGDAVTATGLPMRLPDSTATNAATRFYRAVLVE